MASEFRILSIDGGGIRGLIPAVILKHIEEEVGRPVADCFDLIAGTSTGGVLAVALTRASGDGHTPRWSAEELAALYEREGPGIFDRSLFQRIESGWGVADEKYPRENLESALDEYLGDARLKDALTEVLVTAYEMEQRFPFFFKRRKARENPEWDFPVKSVAYATSAAPTYFEPLKLETAGSAGYYSLIDGGVYANNPALCAYVEARKHFGASRVMLVSLGTGELTRALTYDDVKDWGLRQWIWPHTPILSVMFDGMADTIDYQLEELLEKDLYFRFQPKLDRAKDDMDNASEKNLRALRLQATRLLAQRDVREQFERLCQRLKAPRERAA